MRYRLIERRYKGRERVFCIGKELRIRRLKAQ